MKITTIILDIGNVLVSFCWKKHLHNLGFSGELFSRIANATVLSPQWDEFDKGVLSEEQLLELFIQNDPDIEIEIRRMYENINNMIEVYDYTESWIKDLKRQGFHVYILSNFSSKQYRESYEKLSFLHLTDGAVLSFQEKMIKPDNRIYQLLLNRYHLKADECVFIDDKPANIEGAILNGIHGLLFTTYENTLKALKNYSL